MQSRKQLARVIEQIIPEKESEIDGNTIDDYKKLNDKCDTVINKIKKRKNKSNIEE